MKRKRLPPVKSKQPRRRGNHPANPYPVPEERLEDREGYPFAGYSHRNPKPLRIRAGCPASPEGKGCKNIGERATPLPGANRVNVNFKESAASLPGSEPTFVLRASDPLAAILVRLWAGLSSDHRLQPPDVVADARSRALGMDLWRSAQNPAAGRAGAG